MNNKLKEKKGYGSFFSSVNPAIFKDYPNNFIPENRKLFYSGRHAIKYILDALKKKNEVSNIWLPEYYCQFVTSWLKKNYTNIKMYKVEPLNQSFVINVNNFLKNNDIIIVNNFWGTSECKLKSFNRKVTIIEDHSHGWLSKACLESKADYCFASLRKSVPSPLGGIAWSPNEDKLPDLEMDHSDCFSEIWNNKHNAMRKKKQFEDEGYLDKNLKSEFLESISKSENQMHNNYKLYAIKTEHENILERYLNYNYLELKKDNYIKVNRLIKENNTFKYVNHDATPFGLILHFTDLNKVNAFKQYLINNTIYPSLLWPDNLSEYGYFLNIHIDFRYRNQDITFILEVINNYCDYVIKP